ncbi:F-box associated interaction domain, partial [Arabidopsis thaliana x Arabidopsis arenosa]
NKYRGSTYFLVSFDVRSEKFNYVKTPEIMDHHCTLINYQGKLGFMCCKKGVEIWVMEDADQKQEWSKIIFYEMEGFENWRIAGVTLGGEIVFVNAMLKCYETLYVFYYDPKRNSMRCVEVEGTMVEDIERERKHLLLIWAVPNLVENTMRL